MKRVFNWIIDKKDNICLGLFAFYIIVVFFEATALSLKYPISYEITTMLRFIVFGLFALDLFCDLLKGNLKINWVVISLCVLGFLIVVFSHKLRVLSLILILLAISKYDFNKIAKIALVVFEICFVSVLCLMIINVIPDVLNNRSSIEIRHTLGFSYVTTPMTLYLYILLLRVYLQKRKTTYHELGFHIIIIVLLYLLTNARCDCFIAFGVVLCVGVFKWIKTDKIAKILTNKIFRCLIISIPVVFTIISIFVVVLYSLGNPLMIELNDLLTGRLEIVIEGINQYGIHVFGTNIADVSQQYIDGIIVQPEDYFFIDSSFFNILLYYGVVCLLVFILLYSILIYKEFKKENYWLVFCVVVIFIQSLVEPFLIYFNFNIFVFALAGLLGLRNLEKENLISRWIKRISHKSCKKQINNGFLENQKENIEESLEEERNNQDKKEEINE